MKKKNIPISYAKEVSQKSGYQEIIIFGYDPETGVLHITTYGQTKAQCKDAAKTSNYLKQALNWPEDLCEVKPKGKRNEL